jgi:hypothetical protein
MTHTRLLRLTIAAAVGLSSLAVVAVAADEPAYGPELEGFEYPFPG